MKSIQTRIIFVITAILIVVVVTFLITSTLRTNSILDNDSAEILLTTADYYTNVIDDNFRSTEQSVHTIYNYALKRTETYTSFLTDEKERDQYTYDISELGKSIAENTRGAMAVYLRYNPDDYGPSDGFWYTIVLEDGSWQPSVPTDMSLYAKDDLEHVGWYYIPVGKGTPMWMDPYYNANLGVEMISYIIPYFYDDYTVGIIGMDISMDLLRESVSKVSVYKSGRAFIIDDDANIIYHESYPEGIAYDDLPVGDQSYFKTLLQTEQNKVLVFPGRDGTSQKLILKELKNGMIFGIYVPLAEISAPQQSLLIQQMFIAIVILIASILVMLFLVRSIIKPLNRMTAVAKQYANGNFDEEISEKGDDEVGILSRSLQTMSSSLKEQIEAADAANKAKSDFLANMSHEIRTPINAILGMNEMILRETGEDNVLEYSSNIKTASRTLLSLINSILDFSKIEDGKLEIIPVNYELATMISNLYNSISERAGEKGLDFQIKVDDRLPAILKGDDVRVTQVIMNLLTNAVKYTENGSVTLSIQDGGRNGNSVDLVVKVIDTGIGIRAEDMEKLALSFTRIEEKRNRNLEGTGLGMAIVTKLLAMMGSELKAESIYGKGSSFSFRIAQQVVDAQPIGDFKARVRDTNRKEAAGEYPQILDAKILVVDDYEMNLKVAANLLKIYGIVPDLAHSGKEALEKIRSKTYHMVLLDHMMPEMDGIETLNQIRKDNLIGPDTTMVALTANAVVGARDSYLAAGFDDYLSKPFDLEALGKLLLTHLSGRLAVTELAPVRKPVKSQTASADDRLSQALMEVGISVQEGLDYNANQMDLYRDVLEVYVEVADKKCEEMTGYYEQEDWENYRIIVHATKSSSKTIGADDLFETAKALELAAKSTNVDYIREHHAEFMEKYRKITDAIKEALDFD